VPYFLSSSKSFALSILLVMVCCPIFGQENREDHEEQGKYLIYSKEDKKLLKELESLRFTIREKYNSQDFVATIDLSQQGRALSNNKKFYNYYTSISSSLGNALFQIGDTLQATQIFIESLEKAEMYQTLNNPESEELKVLITAYIDLANILALTGKYELAIEKYKAVLKLTDENDVQRLFIINYNLAESYLEMGAPISAAAYVQETDRLSNIIDAEAYTAGSKLLSGKFFFQMDDFQSSLMELKKSIELAKATNYTEVLIEAYDYSAKAEAELGNYQKAFELSQTLDVLEKEKYDTDRVKAIQSAKAEFEVAEIKRKMEAAIKSEKLEAELRRKEDLQNNTILWSTIALTIAGALIILLLIGFSRRKKLNKDLIEKNIIYLEEKEKSERLLKARNALFSRISHELRTPMYAIVGISNFLIEDNSVPETQKENIQSLKYSADYLLSLINNVLEMNKLNRTSNLALAQDAFDIRELCHHAVESAKYISLDHANTFHVQINDDVSKGYKGDAVKLMQVLINLLGNSNKFTKSGEITLHIDKRKSAGDLHHLGFSIKDTGKGITPRKLKNIFDETKFINHNEENEGTGLGLPISKKILELQDSVLHIQSEPGKGTTVEFDLKLQAIRLPSNEQQAAPDKSIVKDLTGIKILIVEDNKINQLVTKKIIESFNGKFEIADCGLDAIAMVKAKSYDLILMDINMPPGMDGFEATREIRKFDATVPIIALTAVEQIEIEDRMEDSLMNDYLIKPFKTEEFLEKIVNSLKPPSTR